MSAATDLSPFSTLQSRGENAMDKNCPDITRQISANLRKLRNDIPDTMKGFAVLTQAATRDGALNKKTKELIALALGVAAHTSAHSSKKSRNASAR